MKVKYEQDVLLMEGINSSDVYVAYVLLPDGTIRLYRCGKEGIFVDQWAVVGIIKADPVRVKLLTIDRNLSTFVSSDIVTMDGRITQDYKNLYSEREGILKELNEKRNV